MDILIIMCIGIALGKLTVPSCAKKWLERCQTAITVTLIFTLGVGLGQRDGFLQELKMLGFDSFIFFLVPTALSVFAVYLITKTLLGQKGDK